MIIAIAVTILALSGLVESFHINRLEKRIEKLEAK